MHDVSRASYAPYSASTSTPSLPQPSTRTTSADNDHHHRRAESQHRSTQRVAFSNSSDVSMSSTKASTGSSPPPSTGQSSSSSHHNVSLRPSRTTKSSVRPTFGLEQQHAYDNGRQNPHHSVVHLPAERHAPASSSNSSSAKPSIFGGSQPSIFSNPHGIREAPAPLVLSAGTTRPSISSSAKTPTYEVAPPSLNHLGLPGYVGPQPQQQMPGAFPSDPPVPYRRPTDISTQLSMSNESTDQFSSNSDSWDSEGDSGSCLSTSTDATTVASDSTIGKNDTYYHQSTRRGYSSSGSSTPTQTQQDEEDAIYASLRKRTGSRTGGHSKSILSSSGRTTSSVSSMKSTSTRDSAKTASTSSTSTSTSSRRNSQSGGHNIHIEVHNPASRRENQTDARIRQKIEEALLDKIEQLKSEPPKSKSKELTSALKQNHTVRFAEPTTGKETVKYSQPVPTQAPLPPPPVAAPPPPPLPAPVPAFSENAISKELVSQSREIHKLEVELEKRDVLIKERERLEQERKAQEERVKAERQKVEQERKEKEQRALAEREKEKERTRQNLEIQRRENDKERQKERQQFDNDKKDMEKAAKALEKERAKERQQSEKERQQAEKERKEMEKEKARIAKAEKEHEKLQASFVEQGKILSDLKTRFDEQTKTLEVTEAERKELKEVKNEFERRCGDLAKSLSHVSNKEQYVVEQVASLQIIKESLQRRVGPLEKRVEQMKSEIDGLHVERDSLMRETKTYLLRITDLEKEIKNLVEEKRGFMAQVGDLEKDKSQLKDKVKKLQDQTATLESNLEARAKEFAEHVSDLKNKHAKEMETADASTATLKQEHEAALTSLKDGHKVDLDALADEMAGLNEHIDGAHADIEVLHATVQSLETNLVEEKTKYDVLAGERNKLLLDLDGHKSLAVSQETSIMDLRKDVAARSDALAQSRETIAALEAERNNLKVQAETPVIVHVESASAAPQEEQVPKAAHDDVLKQNEELTAAKNTLVSKTSELEGQLVATKTDLEARITQLETVRDAAQSALAAEQSAKASLEETTAAKILMLETEAAQVPAVNAEKADLEAQLNPLRADCARLAEQLAAANKLIEGLTAAQQAGLNTTTNIPPAPSPVATPLSPNFPPPPESPRMAPQQQQPPQQQQRKTRSRAPSMVRSISSRSSATSKRSAGIKDDIALVLVRNPADRGNVQVVRKCDLRAPPRSRSRSRSQPPDKE